MNRYKPSIFTLVLSSTLLSSAFAATPRLRSEVAAQDNYVGFMETTLEIAPPNRLIVSTNDQVREYGPGSKVQLRWEDGVMYIEGQQVRPLPGSARKLWSSEEARRVVGNAPIVLRYVKEHESDADEDEIWTRALELWENRVNEAADEAHREFARLVAKDPETGIRLATYDEAAAVVAEIFRSKTDLVSSARIEPTEYPQFPTRRLFVTWKGQSLEVGFDFTESVHSVEPTPHLFPRPAFDELHSVLTRLSSERHYSSLVVTIDRSGELVRIKRLAEVEERP